MWKQPFFIFFALIAPPKVYFFTLSHGFLKQIIYIYLENVVNEKSAG